MSIDYAVADHIARITLNHPDKANILDHEHSKEIAEAWTRAWEDRNVRVVIVTGAGDRHFCAGHNLAVPEHVTAEESAFLRARRVFWPKAGSVNGVPAGPDVRMGDHYPQIFKPVIAAVNGWAAGAGLYMVLGSTDIRIACAEHARFKFALLTQGWVGTGPGATFLAKQLRYADAMRMLLTDDPVGAEEALRIGLVNEVVPHERLMDRAEELARHIATMPPIATRMMKEFVIRYREAPTDQAWHVQNLMNTLLIQMTADGVEGRRAFNEKRPPNFTGAIRQQGEEIPEWTDEEWKRLEEIYEEGEY